jgi:hypothetical protein
MSNNKFVTFFQEEHENREHDLERFLKFLRSHVEYNQATEKHLVCDALRKHKQNKVNFEHLTRSVARFPHYEFVSLDTQEFIRGLRTLEYNIESIQGYNPEQTLEDYQSTATAYFKLNTVSMKNSAIDVVKGIVSRLADPNEVDYFLHLRGRIKSIILKSTGTKIFSDIDIDLESSDGQDLVCERVLEVVHKAIVKFREINCVTLDKMPMGVVFTGGGVHVILLNRKLIYLERGPGVIANELASLIEGNSSYKVKEAKHSKQGLVPVPSTLKYNKTIVRFIIA